MMLLCIGKLKLLSFFILNQWNAVKWITGGGVIVL